MCAHTEKGITFASVKIERRIITKEERIKIMAMFGFMVVAVVAFALATTIGMTIDIKSSK